MHELQQHGHDHRDQPDGSQDRHAVRGQGPDRQQDRGTAPSTAPGTGRSPKTSTPTYNLFAGQSVTHDYKVTVTPTYTDSAWKVVGTITISNPNDWEAIVADVSDATDLGGTCVVDADGSATVPANDSVNVGYTCTWATQPSSYTGLEYTALSLGIQDNLLSPQRHRFRLTRISSSTNPTEINPTITVDDDNLTGEVWSADRAYAEWIIHQRLRLLEQPD